MGGLYADIFEYLFINKVKPIRNVWLFFAAFDDSAPC